MTHNLSPFTKLIAALVPSTVLLFVLFSIFPYTGLGRILTTPLTYSINLGIVGLGFLIEQFIPDRFSTGVWITVAVLTLVVTVWLYPQEYNPHIVKQIWSRITGK